MFKIKLKNHCVFTSPIDFLRIYENKPNNECHHLVCIFYHQINAMKSYKHQKF